MDSISLWNILGFIILAGPITLSFFTIVAWVLYAAYDDFILQKRRKAVNHDVRVQRVLVQKSAQPVTVQSSPPPTTSADPETAFIKKTVENYLESQSEVVNRDTEKVVRKLLLLFIEQSKKFNDKNITL
jgi:hypothetical protein